MLDLITATRFDGRMTSGRTRPPHISCQGLDDQEIEVIVRLSANSERGVNALIAEAISAMLAADLDLLVPEPFLIRLTPDFLSAITDQEMAKIAQKSSEIAFGSKKLPPGFKVWMPTKPITEPLKQAAAEVFAFDALIENSDRRVNNPNCLFKGDQIAIFDHEFAFRIEPALGAKWPWELGGLQRFKEPESHLFVDKIRGKKPDFSRIRAAWQKINDSRLEKYVKALPSEWLEKSNAAEHIVNLIRTVRENIVPALAEVSRVIE